MTDSDRGTVTRRTVLRGTAVGLGAGLTVGASGAASAQTDVDAWLAETENYDGTIEDRRGQDEVTIDVGAGNGLLFGPAAVRIDPGTTVVWEWTGEGGGHNVHAMEGADFQSETTREEGATFEQTIESAGIIAYQCDPHATIGMKGVLVVGDMQVGTPDVRPDFGGWLADVDGGYVDARGQDDVSVSVGAEGNDGFFAFEPAGLWVDPGTTIVWEWTGEGGDHNVHAQEGASFESELTDEEGHAFEQTLEDQGIVTYQCDPHAGLGMKGAIAVGEDVPTVEPGDGESDPSGPAFTLPGGDPGLSLALAWFGIMGLAAFAVLTNELRDLVSTAPPASEEAVVEPDDEILREIDHEEFQPTGTAALIALYFLILVGLWVFMYFVEFLGNGPTVIG